MKDTYQAAFTVAVDQGQLPHAVHLVSEITHQVRNMVWRAVVGIPGVTFDQQTVTVVETDSGAHRVIFEVAVDDSQHMHMWVTSMEEEIARQTTTMVAREIATAGLSSIVAFDPASVTVKPAVQHTTPVDMRPGVKPVTFSHTAPEPVAVAPARRGWRRLFGR